MWEESNDEVETLSEFCPMHSAIGDTSEMHHCQGLSQLLNVRRAAPLRVDRVDQMTSGDRAEQALRVLNYELQTGQRSCASITIRTMPAPLDETSLFPILVPLGRPSRGTQTGENAKYNAKYLTCRRTHGKLPNCSRWIESGQWIRVVGICIRRLWSKHAT